MKKLAEYFTESEQGHIRPQVGDTFDIVINEELAIEAGVLESTEDKLVLEYDERGISLLEGLDLIEEEEDTVTEGKIKDLLLDIEELTDTEFQDKYNMSKADAKEKFDLVEASDASAEEEDDFHTELDDLVHNTFGHSSDEKKKKKRSNKTYDLYHKTFSDAMQHAYAYAMENLGIEVDPNEIDNEVAMGPPKPATGKTNSYRLLGKDGKKAIQVQVYNTGNSYELNMYKEQIDEADHDKGYINIGGAKVKADKASILQHFKKTFPNVTKIKKDPQHGWVPVLDDELDEAEYQGREVNLGKPMRGDVAKYKVYVKDKKTGNVKKVNFGDKNMEIKRDDPKRRKSFRARHGCGTPKASDRTKARYWSCRMWSTTPVSKII